MLSIIELYLNAPQASATDAAELSLLIRTVAKRASPNVLLPALCNMWTRSLAENAKVVVDSKVSPDTDVDFFYTGTT